MLIKAYSLNCFTSDLEKNEPVCNIMNLGLVSVLTASPFEVFLQPTLTWPFVSLYIFLM